MAGTALAAHIEVGGHWIHRKRSARKKKTPAILAEARAECFVQQSGNSVQGQCGKRQEARWNLAKKTCSPTVVQLLGGPSEIDKTAKQITGPQQMCFGRAFNLLDQRIVRKTIHMSAAGEDESIERVVQCISIRDRDPEPALRTQDTSHFGQRGFVVLEMLESVMGNHRID